VRLLWRYRRGDGFGAARSATVRVTSHKRSDVQRRKRCATVDPQQRGHIGMPCRRIVGHFLVERQAIATVRGPA